MAGAPPFDPTKPFEPVTGGAPPFDPSKPYEEAHAKDYSFSEIPLAAARNAPGSAVRFAKDIARPFIHPVETYESFKNLGMGVLQKMGVASGHEKEKYADAIGKYLADRYGGVQAVKNTLATDPVGILADASMILSGGETALARAPGIVGKAAEVAGTVGRTINPVNAAGQAIKGTAKLGSEVVGGLATGTGGKAINEAFMTGAKAITEPEQGRTFREHYTGRVNPAEAVKMAQSAISDLIKKRGDEYTSQLMQVQSLQPLKFDKVEDAVLKSMNIGTYKGVVTNPSANAVRQQILDRLQMWKHLPEADYHGPLGFDALKKSIRDIRDEPGNKDAFGRSTASGIVAENAAKAIEKTITDADPKYAKVMKAYSDASDIIENLQRELSLGRNANVDTGLKKLQSVLRNKTSGRATCSIW